MNLLSIQVGKPITLEYDGKRIETGIFKHLVSGPVHLGMFNLEGDGQADLRVHGGRDKALYAYGADAYPAWIAIRPGDDFENGCMGENFTFDTLDETKMHVGDQYQIGDAVIEVAQPRFPCNKLGVKYKDMQILKQFIALKRPGVYFRVLQEGLLEAGDELVLIHSEEVKLSITEMFEIQFGAKITTERAQKILTLKSLPENWIPKFQQRA